MEGLKLNAEDVQAYIDQYELPLRKNGQLGSFAEEIIRFGSFVGSSVECHPALDRCMVCARQHIDTQENTGKSVKSGRVILAETLTGSKGRFTRSWYAPQGGLWGCLIHANTLTSESALLLSLAVGIAACEALRQEGLSTTTIRWVNDVLINRAKVAGFLIESHTGPTWKEQFHLIGFGININNAEFPHELRDIATSATLHTGHTIDLSRFALNFIAKLVWNIGLLYFIEGRHMDRLVEEDKFIHPVIQRWTELSDSLGKKVVFGYDVMTNPQYTARVTGIARDGGLEMLLDDGLQIIEHSGEIRYL